MKMRYELIIDGQTNIELHQFSLWMMSGFLPTVNITTFENVFTYVRLAGEQFLSRLIKKKASSLFTMPFIAHDPFWLNKQPAPRLHIPLRLKQ